MDYSNALAGSQLAQAWDDLRRHPALVWVPPMWRSNINERARTTVVQRHAISAVDRNLTIDICRGDDGIEIRLATGPLIDRSMGNGSIDPTIPAAVLDPRLTSVAPTFEQALVLLRDAVIRRYGSGVQR